MEYTKADARNPRVGLNNKPCTDPQYWCRLKELWLSEEDVQRKGCRQKKSFDMMDIHICGCLEKKIFLLGYQN